VFSYAATIASDTQFSFTYTDHSPATGPVDVGINDTHGGTAWLVGGYYFGTRPPPPNPPGTLPGLWDQTKWDLSSWQGQVFPPGAGWRYDWQVWFQSSGAVQWDMTASVVEARWSTDSHTPGDGTFRGDLQPGSLQIQLHDPAHRAETLDKLGTVWLHYSPANFTWGFYLETVTRQLVAPSDAAAADVVLTASTWPLRLTTDCLKNFARPAERVDTRLTALAAQLNGNADLHLPQYTAQVASQSQICTPVATLGWADLVTYPSALSLVRAAAADGVAWIDAQQTPAGLGRFVLRYERWETVTGRALTDSDIVAGIPFDQTSADVITHAVWNGTNAAGAATTFEHASQAAWNYGDGKITMRLWGDLSFNTAEYNAASQTTTNLFTVRTQPNAERLSAVTATSGPRMHPAGTAGPAWNPAAHVWSPIEYLSWSSSQFPGWQGAYWVTKTDHRLRAAAWDSAHTLELYSAATPLPA
jgi:hypothetical protein